MVLNLCNLAIAMYSSPSKIKETAGTLHIERVIKCKYWPRIFIYLRNFFKPLRQIIYKNKSQTWPQVRISNNNGKIKESKDTTSNIPTFFVKISGTYFSALFYSSAKLYFFGFYQSSGSLDM